MTARASSSPTPSGGRPPRYRAPAPPADISPFDGVVAVDKPAGPTSHDVVDIFRAHFGLRKVGHGGTLDPQATGLLLILLGRGTKLSNRFMGSDKIYEGTLHLGITTDSQDADGQIVARHDSADVTREALEKCMADRVGDQFQTPPMVSAVKVDGVPLYKRARKGQEVEREPRFIHVYEFVLLDFYPPFADFRLRCTKGTYVRTLCHDIGEELGCGAHLSRLHRTRSGEVTVEQATPLEELVKLNDEQLQDKIMSMRNFV